MAKSNHTTFKTNPHNIMYTLFLVLLLTCIPQHYAQNTVAYPNDPRSIRLESVMGIEDAMDVRITAPLLNDLTQQTILFPTLWNVSYGFRLHSSQTSVHRVGVVQRTNAVVYRTTVEATTLPRLSKIATGNHDCNSLPVTASGAQGCSGAVKLDDTPSEPYCSGKDASNDIIYPWFRSCCKWNKNKNQCLAKTIESNSLPAYSFVKAIQEATSMRSSTNNRTTCSVDWNCPSRVGTPCRVEINQPIINAVTSTLQKSTTDYDNVYNFVSYFSTGNPDGNRSSTRGWEIKYSATMSHGLVFKLNDQIIQENHGPISSTAPIVVTVEKFKVLEGYNKLEIFGSDHCCSEGGHSLFVRYHETKDVITQWFPWGSKESTLEAVSGYPPPVETERYDTPTRTFRFNFANKNSERIKFNAPPSSLQNILMEMDTTGLLAVTATEGTEHRCKRAGWCSWDITFMTNVLFEINISKPDITILKPFAVNNDEDGNLNIEKQHQWPCDTQWNIERLGQAQIIQKNSPLNIIAQPEPTIDVPEPELKLCTEPPATELNFGTCKKCQGTSKVLIKNINFSKISTTDKN